jgi:hypothetical protein
MATLLSVSSTNSASHRARRVALRAGIQPVSIGYENAGPGSVTFWYGSYHTGTNYNEGSLQLEGPGINITVQFDLLSQTKPLGLIDGTTNFYTDNNQPPTLIGIDPVISGGPSVWQGSTFGGLTPGTYTFTYIPIANPTAEWDPWDDAILSNMVTLSGAIIGGGSDSGIAATESAVALFGDIGDLRQVFRSNSDARHQAAEGTSSMVMSSNGTSSENISVWARVGGGLVNADFGGDLDVSQFYGQAGVEFAVSGAFAAGLSVGGASTSGDTLDEHLDGDAFFIQPYVGYSDGNLRAIASFAYTCTDYDDSTNVIDSGNRYAGSLSVDYDVPLDDMTTATPFAFLAGGTEDLDTSSSDDSLDFVIARAGVELSHNLVLINTGTMNVFGSVAGEYISTNEPDNLSAATLVDYDDSRFGGRVEVGFDFTISGTDSQFFATGYGSGLGTDAPGVGGQFGIVVPF